jgi:hypothetical protein
MVRPLLLLAIVLTTGAAPIAHELCQLGCKAPASASAAATTSGHEHCSQAASTESPDGAAQLSAAPASECRNQNDQAAFASAFAKVVVHPPLLTLQIADAALVLTRDRAHARSSAPASVSLSARTQLRV